MTQQNDRPDRNESPAKEQGPEHADTTFRQLGGDPVTEPGATDTSIAGTVGTDGGLVGEDAPRASDTGLPRP
jgi:hypothetical protein